MKNSNTEMHYVYLDTGVAIGVIYSSGTPYETTSPYQAKLLLAGGDFKDLGSYPDTVLATIAIKTAYFRARSYTAFNALIDAFRDETNNIGDSTVRYVGRNDTDTAIMSAADLKRARFINKFLLATKEVLKSS